MFRKTLTGALCATALALPAAAFDPGAMTDAERQAFRDEVRAYLLENPEVLQEAIAVLQQREADAEAVEDLSLVKANTDDLFSDGHSWVGGNPDGDVTIVEFIDYRCGYCRKAHDEVAELVASDGNIRLIVKEFPILGEDSTISSRFAIATKQLAGDAAYKTVHDELITLRGRPNPNNLEKLANKHGLDGAAIIAQMADPAVDAVIAENHALGQRMRISGTPTFVVQDQMLRGYLPLAGMREVVEEVRTN
ncbi:DsbA family protein [Actibacterium ureilyticum]|uniref:DsbA family protein n=1 Tax=Actibacterium ureilyticum TaxID=1590614 RepID=UPI000BAAF59F|nr:DsbA family protein [Actibacterium ureilyticum]